MFLLFPFPFFRTEKIRSPVRHIPRRAASGNNRATAEKRQKSKHKWDLKKCKRKKPKMGSVELNKNAHRLNRIFRKPKTMVKPRSWRPSEESAEERRLFSGVTLGRINAMIGGLSEDDRTRAAAEQDPPTVVQEELAKRAARFGLPAGVGAANAADPSKSTVVTPEMAAAMQRRMERFGQTNVEEILQKRMERFGDESLAMQRRQARFGS
uniref:WGS project CAEQ00000000 data, annotated contig 2285 n=1 Tax=Trypanosoma congolense (strain IL3000) TaxID=1068625 RepID=F9WCW7_TRYCI|nr:unnamed protein product [Trypanosoma congolense IL3000]